MNEIELIARLTGDLPTNASVVVGPGDDCAVLDVGMPDQHLLFKTDAVVEGVHFTPETDAVKVGRKALARGLSDVAAMGGIACSALITLGLSPARGAEWAEKVYTGLRSLALEYGVTVTGGETTRSPGHCFLSVSLIGHVERGRAVLRSGARPGDAIFVTGELGGSFAGKHLEFQPRLREARWLCDHFSLHSMIDLSDGLASDLRHVLQASSTGAELLTDAIPVSRAAKEATKNRADGNTPLTAALTDGEDYELLFSLAGSDAVAVMDGWKAEFPDVRLGCIGKMTADRHLMLRDKKGLQPLSRHGYVHLQ